MIPHRKVNHEIFGTGLRDRVTACRKRLRGKRASHKARVLDQSRESLPEPANDSEFPASTSRMRQLVDLDSLPVGAGTESEEREKSPLVEEQEVGVT
jgi:hypothetical protein